MIIGARTTRRWRPSPDGAAIRWCSRGAEDLEKWLEEPGAAGSSPHLCLSNHLHTKIWNDCVKKAKKSVQTQNFLIQYAERHQNARRKPISWPRSATNGGHRRRKSSNTKRLAEICREVCPDVQLIERAADLDLSQLAQAEVVGITAGASTPAWIIKEVCDKMSDEIMEIEESFAEMLENSIKTLNTGDKVTGIVVAITPLRSRWIWAPSTPATFPYPS